MHNPRNIGCAVWREALVAFDVSANDFCSQTVNQPPGTPAATSCYA